jgi:DegV family protein with EDD domain
MTTQPSPAEFDRVFRAAAATGLPSVYLTLSSGISGCYEGALAAVERLKSELGPDMPAIYVVDSLLGSTAQALMVVEAIRQREKGLTAEEMARWMEEARYYVQMLFMVDDLKYLARGGRIPTGVAVAGSVLDVKAMLTFDLDGKLAMTGMARGRKKAVRKLCEFYAKNHEPSAYESTVAVGNADCPDDMRRLIELVRKEDEPSLVIESNIGPTIGCHVGPGMLSCVFWGADRRGSAPVADRISREVRAEH